MMPETKLKFTYEDKSPYNKTIISVSTTENKNKYREPTYKILSNTIENTELIKK